MGKWKIFLILFGILLISFVYAVVTITEVETPTGGLI